MGRDGKIDITQKDNNDDHHNDFNKGKVDGNNDNYNSITENTFSRYG